MPDNYYDCVSLRSVKHESKNIFNGYVEINETDVPFLVKNKDGKTVFCVDQSGANIKTIQATTGFIEMNDTANIMGKEDSILMVKNGKIDFDDNLKVNSLKSEKVDVTENISCSTLKSDSLIFKSLKGNDLETLSLKADSMESKIINTGDLYSVAINADKIKTKELDIENLEMNAAKIETLNSSRITTDNIASTHIICENLENSTGLISHIQNETLKSKKLQSENIDCNHLDAKEVVLSTATIDILEARYIRCNTLKTDEPLTFGSNEEPLFLAHTRQKRLKVETAANFLKIVTKVPGGVFDQTFYIDGLDTNLDYNLNITLNKDNHVYYCLINDGVSLKVNLKYNKSVEASTIAKITVKEA